MWAIQNLRLDQEDRFEEMEWSSIMSGAFHNPQMAKKLADNKEFRDQNDGESDVVKVKVTEAAKKSRPDEDPEMTNKILGRAPQGDEDSIMGLSDLIEEERED